MLLLLFVSLLVMIRRLLLHLEESQQICTSNVTDRTTSVLKLLFPHGRHTVKQGLVQLVLSKREIVARQPVYLAIKLK
jgi:hypothetical protein